MVNELCGGRVKTMREKLREGTLRADAHAQASVTAREGTAAKVTKEFAVVKLGVNLRYRCCC